MKKLLISLSKVIPSPKTDLKMKISLSLMLMAMLSMHANDLLGQGKKINLTLENVPLSRVFDEIESTTEYRFIYKIEDVDVTQRISISSKRDSITEFLDKLFSETGTDYNITKTRIYLKKREIGSDSLDGTGASNPQQSINGTVKDSGGVPLPGASIVVPGTGIGVVTDFDGAFSLTVPNDATTLEVSYVGFKKQMVNIDGRTDYDIVLESDTSNLDEVVVVGYGTQKRVDITGSVSSVKVQEIDRTAFTSPEQLLQGRVAGVQLSNVSGNPGGQQRVNIRGIGSLQGDNQPLYVIDGIPVSNTDPSQTPRAKFGNANVTNPLALISPNDIESIEVLKDASSAAIYGSRATNGVILITTKKGSAGKTRISVNAYSGTQFRFEPIEIASTEQYLLVQNEVRTNFNNDNGLSPGDVAFLEPLTDPRTPGQGDTDWIGLITRPRASISDVNVSLSAGNEKTKLYTSFGYFNQEGIINTSRFQRISTNLNVEHKISDSFTFGNSLIGSYSLNNRVVSHGGIDLFSDSREQRPFDTPFDEEGNYNVGGSPDLLRNNGVRGIQESDSDYRSYRLIDNAFLEYRTPLEGLTYRGSVGVDVGLFHDRVFWTRDFRFAVGDGGQLTDSRNISVKTLINNQLTYSSSIGKLNYEVTAVHAFEKFRIDRTFIEGIGFPFESNGSLATATSVRTSTFATPPGVGNAIGENAIESYIGRATMEYDDRYLLNLAIRRDGSSQFAEGQKYGNFPSVSAGWRFSNESFFPKDHFINDGKLRLSWGTTGSVNGVGDFASLAIFSGGFSYDNQEGALVTQLGNDLLTWERSTQTNIGIDLAFLKNRVQLSFDYFNRITDDLLFDRPIIATSGFTSVTQNVGELKNSGIELELTTTPVSTDDFNWEINFNFSSVKNELTELPGGEDIPASAFHILREGESIGSFFLLRQLGVYQTDGEVPQSLFDQGVRAGDVIYQDVNGDGNINVDDRLVVGNAFPDFFGGITNTLNYKGFDFTVFANFSVGNDIYAGWRADLDDFGNQWNKRVEYINNRWTGPGTSNTVPRAISNTVYNNQASTRYLEDGSFLRIRTITLGYTVPHEFLGPIGTLRLYVSAINPFTFTSYSGLDPETSDSLNNNTFGVDENSPPPLRTITAGLNINF
ncbi:TonB-dependent receptor [Muricauda ruestringensis]|uniref:TonB-dependent receptor n=1 Tax=Flagellimonas ruestringensis TaxID=111501 RepID=UPI001CD217DA|nr:TonB-dependent receptor [Allomuricauda ruestringensis]MCA0957462.1 TonB-dependent receptor [Allomuricauda ruestringensis]